MKEYTLSDKYKYSAKTTTKGTQIKYYKNGYYYKLGRHEAICEDLATRVLKYSNLDKSSYLSYEKCIVNGAISCRSYTFLDKDETFVTINSLYEKLVGSNSLADYLLMLGSAELRLKYILNLVQPVIGIDIFYMYMKNMMLIDMLMLNSDRHVHNYGIIYNSKSNSYRAAPIFDNGSSLVLNKAACTLSGSFEDQVVAFGYPVKSEFKIDYSGLYKSLSRYERCIEIDILKDQLEKYKGVFCA